MTTIPADIWRLIASLCPQSDVLSLVCVSTQMRQTLEHPMLSALADAREENRVHRLRSFLSRLHVESYPSRRSFHMCILSREGGPWPAEVIQPLESLYLFCEQSFSFVPGIEFYYVAHPLPGDPLTLSKTTVLKKDHHYDLRAVQLVLFNEQRNWRTFWPRSDEKMWTSGMDHQPVEQPALVIEAAQWLHRLPEPLSFEEAVVLIDTFARNLFRV